MSVRFEVLVPGNSLSFRGGFFGFSSISLIKPAGHEPFLFDTGHHVTRHMMLAALERRGMQPSDIRHVFLSHLHFDHINNVDLFPEASFYVSQVEWDYAHAPDPRDLFGSRAMLDWLEGRKLTFLDGEGTLTPGLAYRAAPGHTPGGTLLHFSLEDGRRVVVAGDACKTYRELIEGKAGEEFDPLRRTPVTLEWIRTNADIIVPGHHPTLERTANGWFWESVPTLDIIVR